MKFAGGAQATERPENTFCSVARYRSDKCVASRSKMPVKCPAEM